MHSELSARCRAEPQETPFRTQEIWVIGVALVLRMCAISVALAHFGPKWIFTRGLEIGLLADALVHGRGISSPFGPPTGPTAMIAPGYPLLMAGIFRVFGSYTTAAALSALAINLVANLLTIWLIMRLARRLAGVRPALAAGSFWACSVPLLWLPTVFWDTSLSCGFLLGAVAIALELSDQSTGPRWLWFGGYCALAGLVNPALLPSLGAIAVWSAWNGSGRRVQWPFLACVLFVVLYLPWPARNAVVFHAWIPTRTTVGLELWMGNHDGSDGYLQENLFPTFNADELQKYIRVGELDYTNQKARLAKEYIRSNPGRFVRLTLTRGFRFWTGSGNRDGSGWFVLHACITTLLGFAGLAVLLRTAEPSLCVLLLLPICLFPLPYYLTHAEFRYRVVLDPWMTVLGSIALQRAGKLLVPLLSQNGSPTERKLARENGPL